MSQFATFEYGQEYPLVWRRDRTPTLTVQADVAPGVLPETVVDGLAAPVKALSDDAAAGIPDRHRRDGRGEREVAGVGRRDGAAHAARHADAC